MPAPLWLLFVLGDALPELHDWRGERVLPEWQQPTARYGRGEPTIRVISPSGGSNAGNITVMVSGTAFRNFGDVKVKFCSVEVRGYVLNEGTITCISPPVSALHRGSGFTPSPVQSTACQVYVTLNGVDYTSSFGTFWYYNLTAVSIAKVRPSGGPVAGGTLVNLTGVGFVNLGGGVQGPKCRFGELVVPATVISHNLARCRSPPTLAKFVPLWLTLDGYTDERSLVGGIPYRFAAPATLSEVHPLGGPSAGGALLTLSGHGFVDDGETTSECTIGDASLCAAHTRGIGIFLYDQPRTGFLCVFGQHGAADPVAVHGTIQPGDSEQLLCRTPDDDALSRVATGSIGPWCAQHGNATRCSDPAYAASALAAVEIRVALNGNVSDVSSTALVYMILEPHEPRLNYVEPWGGPPDGGTLVTIVGENLLSLTERATPMCRFGNLEVQAAVGGQGGNPALLSAPLHNRVALHDGRSPRSIAQQAARLVTCESPPGYNFGSRWIRVSVTLDGEHFSRDTLAFRYTSFNLASVYPMGGFLTGATRVLVRGHGFADFGGLRCVFGDASVPATLVDRRSIRCNAPAASTPEIVTLSVSLNGNLNSQALQHGNVTFAYFEEHSVVISSLSPNLGPVLGGTLVTLHGAGFVEYGTVQCKFGKHDAVNASDLRASNPYGQAPLALREVVCVAPPHDYRVDLEVDGGDEVTVALSLTGGATEFSYSSTTFLYHHPCRDRDRLEGYAQEEARRAVARYTAINSPDLGRFDVNGNGYLEVEELQEAIAYARNVSTGDDSELPEPSSTALRNYARSTCFMEHEARGRKFSDPLDLSEEALGQDGLMPGPAAFLDPADADGADAYAPYS